MELTKAEADALFELLSDGVHTETLAKLGLDELRELLKKAGASTTNIGYYWEYEAELTS